MKKHGLFFLIISLLVVPSGYAAWRNQQRERLVKRAQTALAAAGRALDYVGDYRWEVRSCPPDNEAVFAEWSRRKIDAIAAVEAVNKELGRDSPEAILLSQGGWNIELTQHQKMVDCLARQIKYLDSLLAAQRARR